MTITLDLCYLESSFFLAHWCPVWPTRIPVPDSCPICQFAHGYDTISQTQLSFLLFPLKLVKENGGSTCEEVEGEKIEKGKNTIKREKKKNKVQKAYLCFPGEEREKEKGEEDVAITPVTFLILFGVI